MSPAPASTDNPEIKFAIALVYNDEPVACFGPEKLKELLVSHLGSSDSKINDALKSIEGEIRLHYRRS